MSVTDEINQAIKDAGSERDALNIALARIKQLESEAENSVKELQSQSSWVKYVEGDTETYPQKDGGLYDVYYAREGFGRYDMEHYYFDNGWATDLTVLYYREVPPIPSEVTSG